MFKNGAYPFLHMTSFERCVGKSYHQKNTFIILMMKNTPMTLNISIYQMYRILLSQKTQENIIIYM